MSLPLIYIAGPFRGPTPLDVRRNVEAARDVGLKVAECGGYPIIPHMLTSEFDKQLTDEFWLTGTMELLKRCDAIVLTQNFEVSTGARAEYAWAREHNMPTHVGIDPEWWLRQFVAAVRENMRLLAANFGTAV